MSQLGAVNLTLGGWPAGPLQRSAKAVAKSRNRVTGVPFAPGLVLEIRGAAARTGARVVDWARLESVCTGNSTEGSNPSLSATSVQSVGARLWWRSEEDSKLGFDGVCIVRIRRPEVIASAGYAHAVL